MPILCELTKVSSVEKHDNADSLEIVPFEGFLTITQIGRLKVGDYVVYLAPGSILPDNLLKEMGLFDEVKQQGILSGSGGARVKPKKLRGVVSEGIMYGPLDPARVCEMFNVSSADDALGFEAKDLLGVTKFDPNVFDVQTGRRLGGGDPSMCFDSRSSDQHKYDIENIKKHNRSLENFFAENAVDIVITEKVHGCADKDTKIETLERGTMTIKQICDSADPLHVLSLDTLSGELEFQKVLNRMVQPNNDDWYKVETADGKSVILTGEHPVWVPELKAYRRVDQLKEGDSCLIH